MPQPSFRWPTNVAIAVADLEALMRISRDTVMNVGAFPLQTACAAWLRQDDEWSIWVSPKNNNYRRVWNAGVRQGTVQPTAYWGAAIDIDHLLPRSWAESLGTVAYIRLFPVYLEVNRSAGAGPEKEGATSGHLPAAINGVWYAKALQMRKILGLMP